MDMDIWCYVGVFSGGIMVVVTWYSEGDAWILGEKMKCRKWGRRDECGVWCSAWVIDILVLWNYMEEEKIFLVKSIRLLTIELLSTNLLLPWSEKSWHHQKWWLFGWWGAKNFPKCGIFILLSNCPFFLPSLILKIWASIRAFSSFLLDSLVKQGNRLTTHI